MGERLSGRSGWWCLQAEKWKVGAAVLDELVITEVEDVGGRRVVGCDGEDDIAGADCTGGRRRGGCCGT